MESIGHSTPGPYDRTPILRMPMHQQGVSMMIVLIALVIMSLAAVGLIRAVDTGTLVVGNVAFKQATTSSTDWAAEAAVAWLTEANKESLSLNEDKSESGYYAASLDELDPAGKSSSPTRVLVDWNSDGCAYAAEGTFGACIAPSAPDSNNGYTTQYVITRMCKTVGDPNAAGNGCMKPVANNNDSSPKRGELKYGEDKRFTMPVGPFFRIAARAEGPRGTVSYTETYVYFY